MHRLRAGEWLAGTAGSVLLAASLGLDWFARAGATGRTAWGAFAILDVVLALAALSALALVVLTATRDAPALPVAAAVLTATLGLLALALLIVRLVDEPGPDAVTQLRPGAWVGLAATAGVAAGGWWAMSDERTPRAAVATATVPVRPLPPA